MPSFNKGGGVKTPFGKNQYLRSTRDVKTESYTLAAGSVATEIIDGSTQKILQSGEVLAKITSGADAGKVGPFQALATDGRQTAANIVGINDTFLPWQLLEHDVDIAATYEASVNQAWCFERDAAGLRQVLSNGTATSIATLKGLALNFR